MFGNLFAPILNSTQSAFIYDIVDYPIFFTIPNIMSPKDIKHIQIRVVGYVSNRSIVNTEIYPDGIIYKTKINNNSISIKNTDLIQPWKPGELYKIQLRFGANELYRDKSDFINWKKQQVQENAFSEWSNVMVIKAISKPELQIKNARALKEDIQSIESAETTLTPLIVGQCNFNDGKDKESVERFRFILYNGESNDSSNLMEDSGWLLHSFDSQQDEYRFKTVLENDKVYTITYDIISTNGYNSAGDKGSNDKQEKTTAIYTFRVRESFLPPLEGAILEVNDYDSDCIEDARLKIYLTSPESLTGTFVLTRSSEFTNFSIWEDIYFFSCFDKTFNKELIYTDYTIENGIKYKYAIQRENNKKLRTTPLYEKEKNARSTYFEYSYLYADNLQLKLKYNNKISSFKHTVLSSKSDTLGSPYPTILRNGAAYYAEFPITGLISLQMDDNGTFFQKKADGYYYKNNLIIPINEEDNESLNSNLTNENIFIEKIFREKVEKFLNNGEYKLYKSATEGNMIINLMNVSLTPNSTLGRMIYEFSATAYEMAEFNLDNLNYYNIINLLDFKKIEQDDLVVLFGQLNDYYIGKNPNRINEDSIWDDDKNKPAENLIDNIKEQVEYNIGAEYRYQYEELVAIRVQQYPILTFKNELRELEAEKIRLKEQELPTAEVEEQILYYQKLAAATTNEQAYPVISLFINEKEYLIGVNKTYYIENSFGNLDINSIYLKYSGPIIIDYICKVSKTADEALTVSAIETSLIWGQLAGAFTSSDDILQNYEFKYNKIKSLSIPEVSYGITEFGHKCSLDDVNFSLYKTENIFDIIKEQSKAQVESIYKVKFNNYDKDTDTWDDGVVFYNFHDILSVEIEADQHSALLLTNMDGSIIRIEIGSTEKYILNPSEHLIKGLTFERPTYAIINYKCATVQTLKADALGGA